MTVREMTDAIRLGGSGGGGGGVDTMTAAFTLAAGDDATDLIDFLDEALAATPFVQLETTGGDRLNLRYQAVSGGGGGGGSSTTGTILFGPTTATTSRNIQYNTTTKKVTNISSAIAGSFTLTAYLIDLD